MQCRTLPLDSSPPRKATRFLHEILSRFIYSTNAVFRIRAKARTASR
ncbi:MAG: hypothetical protein JWQ38_1949 [Flavipsychrobacter sp.]|nr:hypothetical protein [Flavipsychrobacter sp.]